MPQTPVLAASNAGDRFVKTVPLQPGVPRVKFLKESRPSSAESRSANYLIVILGASIYLLWGDYFMHTNFLNGVSSFYQTPAASSNQPPVTHYEDFQSENLPPEARTAAEVLGYDEPTWEKNVQRTEHSGKPWKNLTKAQRDAAKILGHNESTWFKDSEASEALNETKNVSRSEKKMPQEKEKLQNQTIRIIEGYVNRTKDPCPFDEIISNCPGLKEQQGGDICILPSMVVKKVRKGNYWKRETMGFQLLNDTRYFPKLIHRDDHCRTLIQENVWPGEKSSGNNEYSANFTYYENFYRSAFDIFNANNIYPKDLNVCCNTIAVGHKIRIIDFGKYEFDRDPENRRKSNKLYLEKMFEDVRKEQEKYEKRLRERKEKIEKRRRERKKKEKEQR